ncbi:hypothetical protein H0H93_015540 [Arthromyces matolae]|nr:hypothetical protein H0H93_015540 [Arthromyces matolae]
MSSQPKRKIPPIIGNFALGRLLGSGYSGHIYEATHIHHGFVVALKLQDVDHECPTNTYEKYLYPLLKGGKGMPTLWAYGEQDGWDYLAIDLLGASLDKLHRNIGGPDQAFDLGTTCSIAMQLISRLETMHARGVLHRDIQLGNTVIGRGMDVQTLYMIDFGFSKRSVNVHCRGKVPSRRDDMEAAALMLIHILTPRGLSWTRNGIPKTDAEHDILKGQKRRALPEDMCRHLPAVFEDFLRYCRSLKFAEQPDYERWIEAFRELKIESGYGNSDDFIWPPRPPVKEPVAPPRLIRAQAVEGDVMQGILNDLTRLDLGQVGNKQVLADQTNLPAARSNPVSKEVIEISSGSEGGESKASKLNRLTAKASSAADNASLSELVRQFIETMRCNSSRTLTKEAFLFLDALHKQLSDPSVFIARTRMSKQRSDHLRSEDKEPTHVKLGVAARLRSEVRTATSNRDMAAMVAEFSGVTSRSTGRTITKVEWRSDYTALGMLIRFFRTGLAFWMDS